MRSTCVYLPAAHLTRKYPPPHHLQDPSKHAVHLCIINLVIGTLYCAKGNFPFGIVRVMKSMEPLARKLETDTWFYVKRCFLALVEGLTKHMIVLPVSDLHWLLLGRGTGEPRLCI